MLGMVFVALPHQSHNQNFKDIGKFYLLILGKFSPNQLGTALIIHSEKAIFFPQPCDLIKIIENMTLNCDCVNSEIRKKDQVFKELRQTSTWQRTAKAFSDYVDNLKKYNDIEKTHAEFERSLPKK